jgi:hypothetical protein
VTRAATISPAFSDPTSVSLALTEARAYGPKPLITGAVAFAAIAAMRDQTFVASLRQAGNSPEHRAEIVSYILANPAYLNAFKGTDEAAVLARDAIAPMALRLNATGRTVRQSAYDVQRQSWSKAFVQNLPGRLAESEAAATADMVPDATRVAEMRQSMVAFAAATGASPPLAAYGPLVSRALQLAAIGALGEARDDTYARLAPLLIDSDDEACLAAAKRNFHQCLAVAKPNYEDIFCTGQHALMDTGACMARAAGVEPPPEPPPPAPQPVVAKTKPHPYHHKTAG